MFGCSQKLYKEIFQPAIQVALFAPGEQCSAAATLGMLYYYMLSHQVLCSVLPLLFTPFLSSYLHSNLRWSTKLFPMIYQKFPNLQENSDFLLCRGEVEDIIFSPWLKSLELQGLKFHGNRVPTSLAINKDTACISGIVCGEEVHEADAFVLANGLSSLQYIIKNRYIQVTEVVTARILGLFHH